MAKSVESNETRRPGMRKWIRRLAAAVLAPLIFVTIVELALRLFGYGYDPAFFVRSTVSDGYRSNPEFGSHLFGPNLNRPPTPMVIGSQKPRNTDRIFLFGASAAKGYPNHGFYRDGAWY